MELKRVVSYVAFWWAFVWLGWDGSIGCLPWALKAAISLLGAIKRTEKKKDKAGRERNEHNQEKTNPIKIPKHAKMELKLAVARRQRRTHPKSEALGPKSKALASKNQFEPLKMLQWHQKSLMSSWNNRTLEQLEETSEKMRRGKGIKNDIPTNRLTT